MAHNLGADATRPSLLLRLRDSSDAEAWSMFVSAYAPLVYGYCRKCGLQDADAADVAQEVLAQVARTMSGFVYERERGRFRDWLRTVTRNRVLKTLGRKTPGLSQEAASRLAELEASKADAEWSDEFHARTLTVALDRIRPLYEPATWRAFERVWIDDRPALETANELGVSIDLVYSAKSRILKRLREEILMLAEDMPEFATLDG